MALQTHAIPGARFVDPKVLSKIRNLELLARHVVDGFINGMHRAPYFGASVDFAEHRGYVAGDDIRRVDWKLYARTDRYFVKQYEADTNANLAILLDVSKSMSFASDEVSKLQYGSFLAASLAYLSHRQIGQRRRQERSVLQLADLVAGEAHRLRDVEQDGQVGVRVRFVLLHEVAIRAGVQLP